MEKKMKLLVNNRNPQHRTVNVHVEPPLFPRQYLDEPEEEETALSPSEKEWLNSNMMIPHAVMQSIYRKKQMAAEQRMNVSSGSGNRQHPKPAPLADPNIVKPMGHIGIRREEPLLPPGVK